MKKLLFITYAFGKSTPVGVGAERMVKAFANQGMCVYVITSIKTNSTIPNVEFIVKSNKPKLPYKISSKLSNLLGRELYYLSWEIKAYNTAKLLLRKYQDFFVIYARSAPISVFPIGVKLKKKFHIPLLMHFTDPIPAPEEWYPDLKNRKRMIKQVCSLLPHADLLSFGNRHMLLYEEQILGISLKNKSFITLDPGFNDFVYLSSKTEYQDSINLLFLGNLYGNRNPSRLFEAIKQLSDYPIKLFLYGNNNGIFPNFVLLKDRTDDILSVMQNMDILVDIDGDDKTPVFISSKLKDYLSVNRPILAITPNNSPSREILSNLSTVCISINETQQIKETILKLIHKNFLESDYEERKAVLKSFDPNQIASEIINRIQSLDI